MPRGNLGYFYPPVGFCSPILIKCWFTKLSPYPARFLRQLSRLAAKHTTRDSTKYTRCACSSRQYHGQRISHAIVMTDALNIHEGILKLKKAILQRRAA